ncbi:MAG: preprotein translocase subunit TatC [delta proteobacterium MLS_D]|jgi:sec-independent protein translocase protein TatC|nr:MAG: preprotein translocase subunit TatC [delta proteobacterium MLS_D]
MKTNNLDDEQKMPLTDHLEELRSRFIRVMIVLAAGFVVCFLFKERIFGFVAYPLQCVMPEGSSMIFTGLPEAFFTYLKVSLFASLFLTSPYTLYQTWKFVSPGLYPTEQKYVVPFVVLSTLFFVGGALFAYFLVFPLGFAFFLAFATDSIAAMLSMKEYLSFSMKLLLAFGVMFELPIFMFFSAKIGLIDSDVLKKNRKYAILLIFIIAATLTPPDVVTQTMMAVPLVLLYELSLWVVKLAERKKKRGVADTEDGD